MTYTLKQQLDEIHRELAMRRKKYPEWVQNPNMRLTQERADYQIGVLEAVRDSLYRLQALEAPSLFD